MAVNNLRVIYQNIIDMAGTTITASSSASASTAATNMASDIKSKVWRSAVSTTSNVSVKLVIANTLSTNVMGLILAFCNLSASSTIRLRGYTGTAPTLSGDVDTPVATTPGTLVFDTGTVLAAPYQGLGDYTWGVSPLATNAYANKKVYARLWLDGIQVTGATSFLIDVNDPVCPDKYIEISRIIMGSYWSPKYNTSYGVTVDLRDMSESSRTEAGDLVTMESSQYNTLAFDLKYMDKGDRSELYKIIRNIGTRKPLFISVFPNNSEDWGKEQIYQCYGKLSKLYGISHPMYEMYSSQIEMEEI